MLRIACCFASIDPELNLQSFLGSRVVYGRAFLLLLASNDMGTFIRIYSFTQAPSFVYHESLIQHLCSGNASVAGERHCTALHRTPRASRNQALSDREYHFRRFLKDENTSVLCALNALLFWGGHNANSFGNLTPHGLILVAGQRCQLCTFSLSWVFPLVSV